MRSQRRGSTLASNAALGGRLTRWIASLCVLALLAAGCSRKASGEGGPGADAGAADAEAVEPGEGTAGGDDERSPAERMIDELGLDRRSFPLLIWSAHVVRKDYFDKQRFDPRLQLSTAVDFLGLHTPEFFAESSDAALTVTVRDRSQRFELAAVTDLGSAADLLERVLEFTQGVLTLDDEHLHELEYTAINGFLAPLDPHTILLTPEENAELGVKTRGRFGGIGAVIAPAEQRIRIERVLPDSPAEAAGLEDLDLILEIDGQPTINLSSSDAQGLLRGPVDSEVALLVRRGDKRLRITVTRGMIAIPTVQATMLPERVAYAQIQTFQEDTAAKLLEALAGFQAEGELAGVVLDLRGNSGGLLAQAVGILNQFVSKGELVIVRSALGREHQDATEELALPLDVPVVALVDQDAASASEIVSGSLKHLDRGVILGRSSFGKGTVQELRRATPYGRELALKMTIAEYRVAGDRKIQSVGVIPDLNLLPIELSDFEGVARLYDRERFERQRERARTAHLPSAVHEPHAAAEAAMAGDGLALRYLAGPPSADETSGEATQGPRELRDPEVRLAHAVTLGLRGHEGRRAQLAALPALVEQLADREAQRTIEAMADWDIDWSPVDDPADVDAPLEVALSLPPTPTLAGEPFRLHIEVKNPGDRTLEQVHLITDCARDELDGIEVLIGKLAPGESQSRDLDLQVMPWHRDFVDELRIAAHVGEPDATPDGEAATLFTVRGAARPAFSYDFWIIDDPRLAATGPSRPEHEPWPGELPFVIQGNGDGLLQPGEQVLLAFLAHNAGGPARDARVLLRNLSGRQGLLEEGLYVHGKLAGGEQFLGAMGISVAGTADPALPLELELIVGDGLLRESVEDKLRFRVLPGRPAALTVQGEARHTARGDDPLRVYNGADASSAVVTELEPGTVVEVQQRAGSWLALSGPASHGRRLWIPSDRVDPGGEGAADSLDRAQRMVDPPIIEIAETPAIVEGERVAISGIARHHVRVRDVVVTVRASGPGQLPHKVFYLANRALEGEAARELEFATDVPLSLGSNQVVVVVRDRDKVERRHELWVYRR